MIFPKCRRLDVSIIISGDLIIFADIAVQLTK